ncbi:Hypothetical predicted protein, partial [Pelobates cultripes]
TPIEAVRQYIPDFNHKLWLRHGILTLSQVLQGDSLKPFPDICQEFRLPAIANFSYNQLQSWINLHKPRRPMSPPDPHWLKITEICTKTKPATKLISLIYTSESIDAQAKPTSFQVTWERDLGYKLTDEKWLDIFQANKKLTLCTTHTNRHQRK